MRAPSSPRESSIKLCILTTSPPNKHYIYPAKPAKIYQIEQADDGWYSSASVTFNVNSSSPPTRKEYRIVGVADHDASSLPLVVKLETGRSEIYVIGFNRQYGVHRQTKEYQDEVIIYQTGEGGKRYSQSWLIAHLPQGAVWSQRNWRGTGKTLRVRVEDITINYEEEDWPYPRRKDDGPSGTATISVNFDNAVSFVFRRVVGISALLTFSPHDPS